MASLEGLGDERERIAEAVELRVRRELTQEVAAHRAFLEGHVKFVAKGLGLVFAVLVACVYYLTGQSITDVEQRLAKEIDRKIIEYRINDALRSQLEREVRVVLGGEEAIDLIQENIRATVGAAVEKKAVTLIDEAVKRVEIDIERLTAEKAIDRVIQSKVDGAIVPSLETLSSRVAQLQAEIDVVKQRKPIPAPPPPRLMP